jgi:hypothetical protein
MLKLLDAIRRAVEADPRTRYRIAVEAKLDHSALSRFMTGERGFPPEPMQRLLDCLGLEVVLRPKRRRSKGKRKGS